MVVSGGRLSSVIQSVITLKSGIDDLTCFRSWDTAGKNAQILALTQHLFQCISIVEKVWRFLFYFIISFEGDEVLVS